MGVSDVTWRNVTMTHEGPYRVADITGWEDLPPARVDEVARSNAHGVFDAPVWAGARTVTVEGYCIDVDARDALLRDLGLASAFSGAGALEPLTVDFAGRVLTAQARLIRSGRTLRMWGVGHFGFQVEWWCPDPRRYGTPTTATTPLPSDEGGLEFPLFGGAGGTLDFGVIAVPGRIEVDNPGSAETWPVYEVTGPLPGGFDLVCVETGERLRYSGEVPAGITVELDSRRGSVSYDGTPGYDRELTRRQWFHVPAQSRRTIAFVGLGSPDPSASLSVTWAPAYW